MTAFAAALHRAGWAADAYDAHVAAVVDSAPPLPAKAVHLLAAAARRTEVHNHERSA